MEGKLIMEVTALTRMINNLHHYRYDNRQLAISYSRLGEMLLTANNYLFIDFNAVRKNNVDLITGNALIRFLKMHKTPRVSKVNQKINKLIAWVKNHYASVYYNGIAKKYIRTYGLYKISKRRRHTDLSMATQHDLLNFASYFYPYYYHQEKLDLKY